MEHPKLTAAEAAFGVAEGASMILSVLYTAFRVVRQNDPVSLLCVPPSTVTTAFHALEPEECALLDMVKYCSIFSRQNLDTLTAVELCSDRSLRCE